MGGKTSTTSSGVTIPPSVLAQYNSVTQSANQTAETPFSTYSGQFVAPTTAEQNTGISNTNTAADSYQPYYGAATGTLGTTQANTTGVNNAATGLAAAGAGAVNATPLTGDQINQYMSPYLNDVLGSTEAIQNQENQEQQSGQLGNAITSGAFGSDRTGIAAANLEEQQNLANNSTIANIANTAYTNAQGVAQQQQGVNLSAEQANRAALETAGTNLAGIGSTAYGEGANTASELGALGTGAQTAGLAGANAQIAAGTVQQQTQQAQDTAQYNQFLQQQSYPFQVGSWLAGISEGIGTNEGSTTTTTQPGGFFSDKRLKHSIQKIGKTYDGQTIYSYKMGDDPRTRIGLIAQEVEKKHPDAVGLAAGFKMVDYGKATQPAANRGHFYSGGVVPFRRVARAYGGGTDLDAVLQAQQQMYSGLGGGSTQRQMPQQASGGHGIAVANAPAAAPKSGISDVNQTLSLANNVNKLSNGSLGTNISNYGHGYTQSPFGAGANQLNTVAPAGQDMGGLAPAGAQSSGATTFAAPDAPAASEVAAPALSDASTAGASDVAASGATDAAAGAATDAAAGAAGDAAAGAATGAAAGATADAAADAAAALAAEYAAADVGTVALIAAKRGGRIHRDVGGGMPYSEDGGAYDIPDVSTSGSSLKAAPAAGKQPTGLQSLMYMGDPNNTSSLAGSMFSNEALATGGVAGRRGYDDGGDVAPELSADDTPDGGLADAATAAPATSSSGVAKTSDPDGQSWFDKHKGTILPILQGLAAMGTAKTVHPGVALAAGLGAGANSYLDTQASLAKTEETQALAQGQQISNRLNKVTNQAAIDALSGKGPYAQQLATGQPATTSSASTPAGSASSSAADIDQQVRNTYAVPPITPAEADYNNRMKALSAATKNPEWFESAQLRQQQRYQSAQFSAQQAAQHEAAGLLTVMNDPSQDQVVRNAAQARYNAVMRVAGSKVEDVGGSLRESMTGAPTVGDRSQSLTPVQSAELQIKGAEPVDTGAPARIPLSKFAANNGVTLPGSAAVPSGTAPTLGARPAPSPAGTANPNGPDFSAAPNKPTWLGDPNHVMTDEEKPIASAYAEKENELREEANGIRQTQQQQVANQRMLNMLPNAQMGPGSSQLAAVQTVLGNLTGSQFSNWVDSNPAAYQILAKQMGNAAIDQTLSKMKAEGANVRLGANESGLILNKLSASPEMAKSAAQSLLSWQSQQLNYEAARQNAIPAYLAAGKDARAFDNVYSNSKPLQGAVSTTAPSGTTLGKKMPSGSKLQAYAAAHFDGDADKAQQFLKTQGYR